MNTITEYSPSPILPSRAYFPPTRRLAVNAKRMAIRISGTKDAESLMADLLASRYDWDASLTLLASRSSAVNDLIVVIPWRLLLRMAFSSATSFRTSEYLTPILLWYRKDPPTITGTGMIARSATSGARKNMMPLTTITVVPTCSRSFAPWSRNLSSWFTSSFIIAIRPPVLCSENHCISRSCMCLYASILSSCWAVWARFLHRTP